MAEATKLPPVPEGLVRVYRPVIASTGRDYRLISQEKFDEGNHVAYVEGKTEKQATTAAKKAS